MAVEFEKFEVYQLAINLTKKIFNLLNQDKYKKEFELTNQIKRAVYQFQIILQKEVSITTMHSLLGF